MASALRVHYLSRAILFDVGFYQFVTFLYWVGNWALCTYFWKSYRLWHPAAVSETSKVEMIGDYRKLVDVSVHMILASRTICFFVKAKCSVGGQDIRQMKNSQSHLLMLFLCQKDFLRGLGRS